MSWRSGTVAAAAAMVLAGCGFHPLYGPDAAKPELVPELASVHVRQISERIGQQMTNELRDALNPEALDVDSAYELDVSLVQQKADILERADGTASRTDSSLTAKWTLKRLSDEKIVVEATSRALTGHDVLPNEYANVVSTNNDLTHAIHEVSTEIETRLAYYFEQGT